MKDFKGSDEELKEFEQTALEYIDSLFNVAMKMTGNREEAEDLVQETYLKMHRFSHTFMEGTNLKAWLFKILRNSFNNVYRKKTREPHEVRYDYEIEDFFLYNKTSSVQRNNGSVSEKKLNIDDYLEDEVKFALDNLPQDFREVVLYSEIEGLSYEEISDVIGCPIGTVKSRLYRARKLLQKLLWNYAKERGYLKEGSKYL